MASLVQSLKHSSLSQAPSNFIDGRWIALAQGKAGGTGGGGGAQLVASHNPAHPERVVWSGVCDPAAVDAAVAAARGAFPAWARWGRDNRFRVLRKFAELCKHHTQRIAELICDETGKVMWEAKGEAAALSAKVDITLDTSANSGLSRVNGFEFEMGAAGGAQKTARCWFKPHGVMGVLGPFNFPAHLPNGHIVPALAMGNTVVFKPSDKAPGVGQLLVELLNEALIAEHAPNQGRGVINLVQGGAPVASALSTHADVDGLLFTGSWSVGRRILEANLDRPGRIVALEMGGNNPAIVLDDADVKQAAIEIVRCAFNTTGQRCTCTRRVIVQSLIADRLFEAIVSVAESLVIADPRASLKGGVFMGPIINDASRQAVLEFQSRCEQAGGELLLPARGFEYVPPGHTRGEGFYISPSIIRVDRFTADEYVDQRQNQKSAQGQPTPYPLPLGGGSEADPKGSAKSFKPGCDHEVFGPLLRVSEVRSLDEALAQANATKYGLAASIFTTDQAAAERFLFECRAGCLNVNTGTAGASSKLPFGGLGHSGNHRPAGSFSLDYCAYPVAGMIERGQTSQLAEGMKWDETWAG